MKLVLQHDVDDLGFAGDVVNVKAGYARNYLIPRRFAVPATANNLKRVEKLKAETERRHVELKGNAEKIAAQLSALQLVIERRVGDEGKLYGSVTTMDIADILKKEGFDILKRNIHIGEPIRAIGEHTVKIKLFKGITADVKIQVKAEETPQT